jgi:uncharacterized membrane protein
VRTQPLHLVAVLSLLVVLAEWLARRDGFRHLGSALLVILLGAVLSNLGVIPAGSTEDAPVPVYDAIFAVLAPLSIFWLLLSVRLRDVRRAGLPLIALFLVGALGTAAGAWLAVHLLDAHTAIGSQAPAIAGMFTGTYVGGSLNFNAVALEYGVMRDGLLYGGTVAVDNIITTLWIVATLAAPRLLAPLWLRRRPAPGRAVGAAPILELAAERETITPSSLAVVVALGATALLVSQRIAAWCAAAGWTVPSVLILTTLALLLAQLPVVARLAGARALGMYAVYCFLAVIGAFCDLRALSGLGALGATLLAFAFLVVLVHGLLTFATAWLLRMDLEGAAVASQANVGGATSALALAKSLGRDDLLVPGILLGSLGNGVGTFLAFAVARASQP